MIGNSGNIIAADMQLSAPALTAADIKVQVPGVYADNWCPNDNLYRIIALFGIYLCNNYLIAE